jgi:hypothetical protein
MYRPLRVFFAIGVVLMLAGLAIMARFLVLFILRSGAATGNIQSLLLAAILFIIGFQTFVIGLVADLIAFNRKILEEILYRVRKLDLDQPAVESAGMAEAAAAPDPIEAERRAL